MKIGDKVEWSSQAQGSSTKKEGIICAIIPPRTNPRKIIKGKDANLRRMFDGWDRDGESYIVKVIPGKTDRSKPVLYWPRVSGLKKVEA